MYDLTTIGDIKLDVFIDLGKDAKVACSLDKEDCRMSIKYGEKIPVDSAITMMAGSAPNISIGVRRLGATASIISVVGEDTTATLAMDGLKKEGIPTEYVTIAKGTQSSFSAVLNFEGESTILAVHRPHAYTLPDNIRTDWMFVSEMGPKYKSLFKDLTEKARNDNVKLGINPGAIQLEELSDELINLVSVCELLIVNVSEAQLLTHTEIEDPKVLLRTLQEMGPKTVIITDGKEGAYGTNDTVIYHAPMFPGERLEATGAGDAFASGVLAALIADHDLPTALSWGSVNAAWVVQYIGPQEGLQTRTQVETQLKETPHKVSRI